MSTEWEWKRLYISIASYLKVGYITVPSIEPELRDKEKELMLTVLSRTDWDLLEASRLLQIPVSRLKQKIRHHGLKQKAEN